VYTVHNYYLCPSLAVFLCVLLLSSLGCIYAVAKTHHSLNYSIWTRDFSPVFFWGLLVFSRIPFGTLHRHPPPLFFRLGFSTVYLGTCIHFFFDFSTKWKNKFFFYFEIQKWKVCPGLRSIDFNYNQMKGRKEKINKILLNNKIIKKKKKKIIECRTRIRYMLMAWCWRFDEQQTRRGEIPRTDARWRSLIHS
jgi:hypothetical protein